MPLGLYVSVPFCKTKCTYCNFASGVFSREKYDCYVERLCSDIAAAPAVAPSLQARFEPEADSIYLGGGTPTVLTAAQLHRIFSALREQFAVANNAEVTVECAPGTLNDEVLETLLTCGVNRVSLGVQSFVNEEARAVGRLHTREIAVADIERLRAAGIHNINIDLIAGLPHQTFESWRESLDALIESGVPHASVYMLEIDQDSRLGTELLAGGQRYDAHHVPDDELIADLYESACERLNQAGIAQYEISNFARRGYESKHNLKYWKRQPYFGFGVDAHSMLPATGSGDDRNAVRFSTSDSLEDFLASNPRTRRSEAVSFQSALEEEFFLGLRMNVGIDMEDLRARYGNELIAGHLETIAELCEAGLLQYRANRLSLTDRGRLLSNEVFERFIGTPQAVS